MTLRDNFKEMLLSAKRFEIEHGRDKGNGWLLQHPIKKLALYKESVFNARCVGDSDDSE